MHYSLMITISLAAAGALFLFAGCTAGGSYLERAGAVTMKGNPLTLRGEWGAWARPGQGPTRLLYRAQASAWA